MKTLFVLFLVAFISAPAFSQSEEQFKYFVPLVINETDTIPGTESGGIGAGGAGWLYVGHARDVTYSVTSVDSTHFTVVVDYADTGYAPATGTSARAVGFKSYVTTLVTDTVANFANSANPKDFTSRVLRQAGGTDNLPAGRYIRFRVLGVNVASKLAGAAADRTVRLTVHLRRYAPN